MSDQNHDRLQRAIRALQLLQRNTVPSSPIGKAVGKALIPLLQVALPAETQAPASAKQKAVGARVTRGALKVAPETDRPYPESGETINNQTADAPVGSGG